MSSLSWTSSSLWSMVSLLCRRRRCSTWFKSLALLSTQQWPCEDHQTRTKLKATLCKPVKWRIDESLTIPLPSAPRIIGGRQHLGAKQGASNPVCYIFFVALTLKIAFGIKLYPQGKQKQHAMAPAQSFTTMLEALVPFTASCPVIIVYHSSQH